VALGLNASDFEKAYFLDGVPAKLNLAFSQHTNDSIVEKYKKALNEIKKDGTFDRVLRKWGM
jgi:ABC-type amino acid transport substrate-binding protein